MEHPYIPNAVPEVKASMLAATGAADIEEFYADIPESLRLRRPLDLPPPLRGEAELVRHVGGLLDRNTSTRDALSFLGGGCYAHHVPAVCDEVNSRSEFLTAYAGEPYEDHGRFQALWEYQSLMGELLEMDVVNVPVYDGFQATATALRMAARITGRGRVALATPIDPDLRSKLDDYLKGAVTLGGPVDGDDLAAVYIGYPTFLGVVDPRIPSHVEAAHAAGGLAVVGCDPIGLGVLAPPSSFGADIVCGDIQSLGMHPQYGGGHAGFIATRDEERFVEEFPSRLFGLVPTTVDGEYGFGDVAYERTSFARREQGKEWVGTAAALWGITAGVYLALMGPTGMRELGEGLMARCRHLKDLLAGIDGIEIPDAGLPHLKEFVVTFTGRTVAEVNAALRERGIFGGHDLSEDFPHLGRSALYCVTELHTKADLDRLAAELKEVLA
ncbi:aminomethyl-transferring glycine dehydrogenase subunit GcvPA [Phytomonospora endophytica]|uniref:Glycine dehydrogenase subunit 1 n=1 Tax=Phytomonospora endophytica TaxID=714109 RepID=A0A841FZQ1_9ACTN|nr:aminomethyl-transferring glycine dehydrogenase subunit GcvPA [Phytomonospora endophytica]MBB6038867.1 glycine dehydrogenase subunit 1 [Phytomonospora endophytica]GIG68338.1 putative glycine dehydrogenase (decarboxylating) subunit 1 [Phytomonospora endophytica]